jgi:hypothetical protein
MREPNRIPIIIERLRLLWIKHPDLRLGQLIENMVPRDQRLYFIEDVDLIEMMEDGYDE